MSDASTSGRSVRRPAPWEPVIETVDGIDVALRTAMEGEGEFWPGEFVCPVVRLHYDGDGRLRPPIFYGTATLLGGDLFLTARHVRATAFDFQTGGEGIPSLGILDLSEGQPRIVFAAIEWCERHPDATCDLALGKLGEWNARSPWAGWGSVSPLNEVFAVGYPLEAVAPIQTGDMDAINNPRYLRGYVTRGLDTVNDSFAQPASFEVSFSFSPGMSGSPVWGLDANGAGRVLCGIAIGAYASTVGREREDTIKPDGTRIIRETVRVEEYGAAVRLATVLDWEITTLGDGRRLGDLVPGEGTGQVPEHLRQDSPYWTPVNQERSRPGWVAYEGRSPGNRTPDRPKPMGSEPDPDGSI
jgi:hypothetical protein